MDILDIIFFRIDSNNNVGQITIFFSTIQIFYNVFGFDVFG